MSSSSVPLDLILRVGRCEQPGTGWEGIAWDHHGTFNGGLGILNVNWTIVAREQPTLPDPEYLASPSQQIEGFRRHARRVGGLNGWSCWTHWHRSWGY